MWGEIISIRNLALLLAVLIMGLSLISSVSAMDVDDSDLLSASDDVSGSDVSGVLSEVSSTDSDDSDDANGFGAVDSHVNDAESKNIGPSDENSQSEVLSTDTVEDSDLEYELKNKNSKGVLGSSALQATSKTKTKTSLSASSSSVYRGNKFYVTLKSSAGKVLAKQKVSFTIVGKTYTQTTDSKGIASLAINLANGKYPLICSFAGNSAYKASSLSLNLTVNMVQLIPSNSYSPLKRNQSLLWSTYLLMSILVSSSLTR